MEGDTKVFCVQYCAAAPFCSLIQSLQAMLRSAKSRKAWISSELFGSVQSPLLHLTSFFVFCFDIAQLCFSFSLPSLTICSFFFKKKHSSIISFTPQVKLHSAGFMRAVDTFALPPLLPHSLYQDFNPRLSKINSHALLSSNLLQPPTTSSNNPLSGCSLTFQLPFLWLY